MSSDHSQSIWFPEPEQVDNTFARRGEGTFNWLARSTVPRAKAARAFLNRTLSKLPFSMQEAFVVSAKSRWHSAFFEIIVARILQELGATIEVEKPIGSGRKPDFTAHFEEGSIIVEAVSPVFNAEVVEEAANRNPLLDFIEGSTPTNWRTAVLKLPSIRPDASKKEFKSAILRLMETLSASESSHTVELIATISTGKIHLVATPVITSNNNLLSEGFFTTVDNSEERIRHAIKKKKDQVRDAPFPVLLAIQGSGISTGFDDFDQALFGHTYEKYIYNQRVEVGFKTDGLFTHHMHDKPKYAGVLAFLELSFLGGVAPVLYLDPRFKQQLPSEMLQIRQRYYDVQSREIKTKEEITTNLMMKLDFIRESTEI